MRQKGKRKEENSFQRIPTFSAYRINSREEVTIRNRATLMTWPVTPAAVTKQVVMGS